MSTCDHICRECGQVMNCQHCKPYQLPVDRVRISELEAEVRALLHTILTISENGNDLAQTVVESYARNGRDLFAERRELRNKQ
jgi:hypothetical protein